MAGSSPSGEQDSSSSSRAGEGPAEDSYEWTAESLYEESRRLEREHRERVSRDPDHIDWDSDNPYDILGVDITASFAEVSAVHRRMAKRFHPDANPEASRTQLDRNLDRMGRINQAFNEIRSSHLQAKRSRADQVARHHGRTDRDESAQKAARED